RRARPSCGGGRAARRPCDVETVPTGPRGQLGAVADAERCPELLGRVLDGMWAEVEPLTDLPVGQTERDQLEQLKLQLAACRPGTEYVPKQCVAATAELEVQDGLAARSGQHGAARLVVAIAQVDDAADSRRAEAAEMGRGERVRTAHERDDRQLRALGVQLTAELDRTHGLE